MSFKTLTSVWNCQGKCACILHPSNVSRLCFEKSEWSVVAVVWFLVGVVSFSFFIHQPDTCSLWQSHKPQSRMKRHLSYNSNSCLMVPGAIRPVDNHCIKERNWNPFFLTPGTLDKLWTEAVIHQSLLLSTRCQNVVFGFLFHGSLLRHRIPLNLWGEPCTHPGSINSSQWSCSGSYRNDSINMITNTYWPLTLCEEQRESFTLISASNAHNPMKTVVNFLSDR